MTSTFAIESVPFVCPICQSPIQVTAKAWVCDGSNDRQNPKQSQHSFDVARQGYVHLLPVQHKKSKRPGDSQDSVAARQRFLAAGYYAPLQSMICKRVAALTTVSTSQQPRSLKTTKRRLPYWLDIGCGEGYYTQAMSHRSPIANMIAVDISKPAVMALARSAKARHQLWQQQANNTPANDLRNSNTKDTHCSVVYPLVASAANLPIAAESVDGISSIFSPILAEVFTQVLKPGGWLVIAKPDLGHLASVRAALFEEVHEHNSDKFLTKLDPYFDLISTDHTEATLELDSASLADLLTMTPYSYRAKPSKREALLAGAEQAEFSTQAKFVIYVLKKR